MRSSFPCADVTKLPALDGTGGFYAETLAIHAMADALTEINTVVARADRTPRRVEAMLRHAGFSQSHIHEHLDDAVRIAAENRPGGGRCRGYMVRPHAERAALRHGMRWWR